METIQNKEELFEKHSITEEHKEWSESIDNWISVEIFKLMHGGRLPTKADMSFRYLFDFLDHATKCDDFWKKQVMIKQDWGKYFLTAKRMVYRNADKIVEQLSTLNLPKEKSNLDETLETAKDIFKAITPAKPRVFTEAEIQALQTKVHQITGDGEVMMLFNELLGIQSNG